MREFIEPGCGRYIGNYVFRDDTIFIIYAIRNQGECADNGIVTIAVKGLIASFNTVMCTLRINDKSFIHHQFLKV